MVIISSSTTEGLPKEKTRGSYAGGRDDVGETEAELDAPRSMVHRVG